METFRAGWDRTFLDLSSKMAEPFCSLWHDFCYRFVAPLQPNQFENCDTKVKEIGMRALIGLRFFFIGVLSCVMPVPVVFCATALGLGSRAFRAIGFYLQKDGFTHVRGKAKEKSDDSKNLKIKMVNWNICGVSGGLTLDHGGVIEWPSRLEGIVKKIKGENPDVIILEEVYDTALAEAIIQKLQNEYAHFFIHLGPSSLGSTGGSMVISKFAVSSFTNTSFTNNSLWLNRSFATLEIKANPNDSLPSARIIGTHLIHGITKEDQKKRAVQMKEIVNDLRRHTQPLPTLLAGDLNIERDHDEGRKILSPILIHSYRDELPTCTEKLVSQWTRLKPSLDETIDYISFFKRIDNEGQNLPVIDENVGFSNCHLIKAFDETFNTKTALSDHHGIAAEFEIMKR